MIMNCLLEEWLLSVHNIWNGYGIEGAVVFLLFYTPKAIFSFVKSFADVKCAPRFGVYLALCWE